MNSIADALTVFAVTDSVGGEAPKCTLPKFMQTHFVGCSEEYNTLWEILGGGPTASVNSPGSVSGPLT
jgi:hypothetical protein